MCLEAAKMMNINVNCVDPWGRSALVIAIENENTELLQCLLSYGLELNDALWHAIEEEYLLAVELILVANAERSRTGIKKKNLKVSMKIFSFWKFSKN